MCQILIHINVCSSGVNFIVGYQLYSEAKTIKVQVQRLTAARCFAGDSRTTSVTSF
jgi:hypothetical protein